MIFGEGALGVAMLFLWVFCIADCIAADPTLVRNLPKLLWLLIVIILPDVGSILWLILGRPSHARFIPGSTERRVRRTALPPDDDPDFQIRAERMRLQQWQEDLRRREEELRRKKDDGDDV